MIEENVKKRIIEEVKNGASYRSVAIKYDISVQTVRDICIKEGVKSKFKQPKIKYTDDEIITVIKKHKVITQRELEKELGYINMTNRIFRMAKDGKLYILRIHDRRFIFVDKNDFKNWIVDKLTKTPRRIKKLFIEKLKDLGIEIDEKKSYTVGIDNELYEKIKEIALKKGLSIKKFVSDILAKEVK